MSSSAKRPNSRVTLDELAETLARANAVPDQAAELRWYAKASFHIAHTDDEGLDVARVLARSAESGRPDTGLLLDGVLRPCTGELAGRRGSRGGLGMTLTIASDIACVQADGQFFLDAKARGVFEPDKGDFPIAGFTSDVASLAVAGIDEAVVVQANLECLARAAYRFAAHLTRPQAVDAAAPKPGPRDITALLPLHVTRATASGAALWAPIASSARSLEAAARWLTEHLPIEGWFGTREPDGSVSCAPSRFALPEGAEPLPAAPPKLGADLVKHLAARELVEPRRGKPKDFAVRTVFSTTCRLLEQQSSLEAWIDRMLHTGLIEDVFGDDAEVRAAIDEFWQAHVDADTR